MSGRLPRMGSAMILDAMRDKAASVKSEEREVVFDGAKEDGEGEES